MTTETDWKKLFLKYVKAVIEDDFVVGMRCLEPRYGEWSIEEQKIMIEIHKEVWPTDLFGPWNEEKYDRDLRAPCERYDQNP